MASFYCSPLTKAILENDITKFRKQLHACRHVDIQNNLGWTPFHIAVQTKNIEIITDLLNHPEVNVQRVNFKGATSLYIACKSKEPDLNLVQLLISHGVGVNVGNNENRTPLHLACKKNHVQLASLLIRNGANVNVQEDVNRSTPLHVAIESNSPELVTLLLESGADANITCNHNLNALTLALYMQRFEIARFIVPFVSNLDKRADDGWAALHFAVNSQLYDLTELLLKRGANVHQYTTDGYNPLFIAVTNKNYEIFQLLWKHVDYNLISCRNTFFIKVCKLCTLQNDWCYFNTLINTPRLRYDLSCEYNIVFYLFESDNSKDFETTKEYYFLFLDWLFKCNYRLQYWDIGAFINHISDCPYKADLIKFFLNRTLPDSCSQIKAIRYSLWHEITIPNILLQYMIPLQSSDILYDSISFTPEYKYLFSLIAPSDIVDDSINFTPGLKYLLSLFTPSFAMKETLLERLRTYEDLNVVHEFTDILENRINSVKSLTELTRDCIREQIRKNCSNWKFVDSVQQMDIPQLLKDIICCKVSVNNM